MTRSGRIISLSSCSRIWQCQTNLPLVGNRTLILVITPGGQSTVSLRPVSQAGGNLGAPCGAILGYEGLSAKYDVGGSSRHPLRST